MSLASDSSETVVVTTVKLGAVTNSDMRMHYVLMILNLTVIQSPTDLNHENNKCLIISDTIQVMPIKFAVKIVRLKPNAVNQMYNYNLLLSPLYSDHNQQADYSATI